MAAATLAVSACHAVTRTGLAQGWIALALAKKVEEEEEEEEEEDALVVLAPREDGREDGRGDGRRAAEEDEEEGTRKARRAGSSGVPLRDVRRSRM